MSVCVNELVLGGSSDKDMCASRRREEEFGASINVGHVLFVGCVLFSAKRLRLRANITRLKTKTFMCTDTHCPMD